MKIGILTFHRAINYGAVLQAYALRKKLEMMGNEVEIIDYICPKIRSDYLPEFSIKKSLKTSLNQLISAPFLLRRRKKFFSFITNNLVMSEMHETANNIEEKYDMIITGSDQVWQYNLTGNDDIYFLKDFEDVVKVAYAASFSLKNNKISERQFNMLKSLDFISVRERENADFLKRKMGRYVDTVCDPTFLLSKKEWEQLSHQMRPKYKNYVLAFNVLKTNGMLEFAFNLAKSSGKQLIVLTTSVQRKVKGKYIRTADPIEFLSLIENADFIVTNSFHGTAFSIIFQKEFFVETIANGGIINTRVLNLLDSLHIRGRSIENRKNREFDSIDYQQIQPYKENLSKYAVSFLSECLTKGYKK